MLVVTVIFTQSARQALSDEIDQEFKRIAAAESRALSQFLIREVNTLSVLALNPKLQSELQLANQSYVGSEDDIKLEILATDKRWQNGTRSSFLIENRIINLASVELKTFQRIFPDYKEILATDQYGAVLAGTERPAEYYHADQEWWQSALKEGSYIGLLTIEDRVCLKIALPIFGNNGKNVLGMMLATYDLNDLNLTLLSSIDIGRISRLAIIMPEGILEIAPEGLRPIGFGRASSHIDELRHSQSVQSTKLQWGDDPDPFFVSFAPVSSLNGPSFVDQLDWGVIVGQSEKTLLASVEEQRRANIFLGLVLSLLSLMAVAYFSNRIIQPISNLTDVAQRIQQGDLTAQATVETTDEIGTLALAFNSMTAQLRANLEELEQRVAERTDDLLKANQLLTKERTLALSAQKEAELANQAKSEFLSNVTHDLRTPLNGILGYAQVLEHQSVLTKRQRKAVQIISQSGTHLLRLINDILDISKIEARKMVLSPTPLHFAAFLESIVGMIRMRAEQKGLLFLYQPEAGLPVGIEADKTRLSQVLLNLLSNAVKFTDRGQVVLSIKPLTHDHSTIKLRFEVSDSGRGISQEELAKIFLPFEQTIEGKRQANGTGLGLSISQSLVHLMGGRLQVKSQVGQGSTFWFDATFPIVEQVEALATSKKRIIAYKGQTQKVLVVDDEPSNRLFLINLLESLGFEVIEAKNGQQGVQLAQRMVPDLILTDLVMPEMDGQEMIKQIRQRPALQNVVVIAISANLFGKKEEMLADTNGFLPKPLETEKLFALLQDLMELEWLYEEQQQRAEPPIVPTEVILPPPQELETLYQLAKLGNMRAIRKQAQTLKEKNSQWEGFAKQIEELAKSFQEKKILALIKEYRS